MKCHIPHPNIGRCRDEEAVEEGKAEEEAVVEGGVDDGGFRGVGRRSEVEEEED